MGSHLVEGKKFFFRITVLQATGIPRDFTDVFVQFKYAQLEEEGWGFVIKYIIAEVITCMLVEKNKQTCTLCSL